MKRIFVDTNILIDYSKGYKNVLRALLTEINQDQELCVNDVVVAEFFSDRNLRNPKKLSEAKEFIRLFEYLDSTRDVGILAGVFISQGTSAFLGDSLIAATCITHDCMLCTRNQKDFAKIPQLKFYT